MNKRTKKGQKATSIPSMWNGKGEPRVAYTVEKNMFNMLQSEWDALPDWNVQEPSHTIDPVTATISNKKRYANFLKTSEVYEQRKSDVEQDLRRLWTRYQLVRKRRNEYDRDRFPDDLESIRLESGEYLIGGTSSYRGCSDRDYCRFPQQLVEADDADREALLATYADEREEEKAVASRQENEKKEADEREQLAYLETKYRKGLS